MVVFPAPGNPTSTMCGPTAASASFSATEPGKVTLEAASGLVERVAAEFLEQRLREDKSCHRFGDDPHRRHRRDIASFRDRLRGVAGLHLDRAKRTHECAYRFHGGTHDDLLAVADAAF